MSSLVRRSFMLLAHAQLAMKHCLRGDVPRTKLVLDQPQLESSMQRLCRCSKKAEAMRTTIVALKRSDRSRRHGIKDVAAVTKKLSAVLCISAISH